MSRGRCGYDKVIVDKSRQVKCGLVFLPAVGSEDLPGRTFGNGVGEGLAVGEDVGGLHGFEETGEELYRGFVLVGSWFTGCQEEDQAKNVYYFHTALYVV